MAAHSPKNSQRRAINTALGRRAVSVAIELDAWSARLLKLMKSQGIELSPKQNLKDFAGDRELDFVMSQHEVRTLVIQMQHWIADIRKFSK